MRQQQSIVVSEGIARIRPYCGGVAFALLSPSETDDDAYNVAQFTCDDDTELRRLRDFLSAWLDAEDADHA